MNLLTETLEELKSANKQPSDVLWCGSKEFGFFSWEEFKVIADVEYDSGFGCAEVAQDLIIAGKDFWLERCEYDGSEGWEYKKKPKKPLKHIEPKALTVDQARALGRSISCGWEDLIAINGKGASHERS